MELIDILRAKDKKSEKYLLKEHILETLKRLEQYHQYVNKNKEGIEYEEIKKDDFFKNLAKTLFIHDLGKIDYNFQKKVFDYKKGEYDSEEWKEIEKFLEPITKLKNIRHEILSSLWSVFLLGNTEWDKKIRTAILLHHYNEFYLDEKDLMEIIVNYKNTEKYLEFVKENKEELLEIIKELIKYINENTNSEIIQSALNDVQESINFDSLSELLKRIKEHDDDISELAEFYEINNESPDYDFLVFLGVMRRCDYSASGEVPIENNIMKDMHEIFKEVSEKIKKKINIEKLWQSDVMEKYKNKGKNLILIAPTGSGKTEFALLWAKEMKRKLIYTLPLRVALNDLFIRFGNEEKGYFNKDYVDILHSTSFIEYVNEERSGKRMDIEHQVNSSKMFSSPIILTTPDQVFLTSLNFYGSDKLISLYPSSSIVIDEIQTYNEEMAAIILRTLQIINELHGNTLIITATFPPYFEKFLKDEKFFNEKYTIIDLKKEGEIKDHVKNYNLKRHKISLIEYSVFEEKIADKKSKNKKNEGKEDDSDESVNESDDDKEKTDDKEGKKEMKLTEEAKNTIENNIKDKDKNILIIVNNVMKAINIFKTLEKHPKIDQAKLYLLHSRLIEKEKTNQIKEIKDKLDKKEKGIVVVATQIVEASVDIDFDILITEISTIDSQIQRWGRIYRNRGEKNYNSETPNVNIFVGKEDNGKHKIDKGTKYIYDEKVIQETIKVLKNYEKEGVVDYEKEREMIEKTFESKINDKTLKENYEEKIDEILNNLKYFAVEKRSEAQRLFRNIAGTQVIVPQLMEEDEDDDVKKFAEIIQDSEKKNCSWEEIIKDIKDEDLEQNKVKEITKRKKWELKKALYEYSVNVPQYYVEKYHFIIPYEFKGFNILKIDNKILNILNKNKEDIKNDIKKYGIDDYIDSIKNIKNIEEFMMGENII